MEFIFGNSGEGYGLLYKTGEKDIAISEYMQKINKFDINSGTSVYAYKTISGGKTLRAIFNMCAKDEAFKRGVYYNHVKWTESGRDYFINRDFFKNIRDDFASQEDIDNLRESQTLKISAGKNDSENLKDDLADRDKLYNLLYALYSEPGKKIAFAIDSPENCDFNNYARKIIQKIFSYLNVDLRISASYITSCGLDLFKNSDYRLCVIPSAFLKNHNENDIIVIKSNDTKSVKTDDWAEYISWLFEIDPKTRDVFFEIYEKKSGANKTNAGNGLIEYYKYYKNYKKKINTSNQNDKINAAAHTQPKTLEPPPVIAPVFGNLFFSGASYTGDLLNGVQHGWGTMIGADGICCTGEWTNGEHIRGFRIDANGNKSSIGEIFTKVGNIWHNGFGHGDYSYAGGFSGNNMHGQGTMIFASGDFYTGALKKGQRHGWGLYRFGNNGDISQGYWENNKLTQDLSKQGGIK